MQSKVLSATGGMHHICTPSSDVSQNKKQLELHAKMIANKKMLVDENTLGGFLLATCAPCHYSGYYYPG